MNCSPKAELCALREAVAQCPQQCRSRDMASVLMIITSTGLNIVTRSPLFYSIWIIIDTIAIILLVADKFS